MCLMQLYCLFLHLSAEVLISCDGTKCLSFVLVELEAICHINQGPDIGSKLNESQVPLLRYHRPLTLPNQDRNSLRYDPIDDSRKNDSYYED